MTRSRPAARRWPAEKRLELLDLLAQGERTVEALAKAAGLNLTTASAHLQTLKQAGFVATRRDGVRIHYRLAGDDVARLFALLRKVAENHQAAVPPTRDAYLGRDGAAEVTRAELRARLQAGGVVVLDVRPVEEYLALATSPGPSPSPSPNWPTG
ncbi:metalloregulator ArsR/SmtB family transcription factor [Nonomuraea ferruginea]